MITRIGVSSWPFVALGLYVVYASSSMSVWSDGPEEGFLPLILGCGLIGLSAILFTEGIRAEKKRQEGKRRQGAVFPRPVYSYVLLLLFYSLTVQPLGFLVSTALSLTILLRWIEKQSWTTTAAIAVGSNIALYLLFSTLLGVSLPRGWFW